MTSTHLNHLVAAEHNADLRRVAERERAAAGAGRPRRRRRAPFAVVLAALLALTLAASAQAAGHVWVEAPGLLKVEGVTGTPISAPFTLHNDMDTPLRMTDIHMYYVGPWPYASFTFADPTCPNEIPVGGQCAGTATVTPQHAGTISLIFHPNFLT